VIVAVDIWKSYGDTPVLRGAAIALEKGVTCIRGPNGAGKTTLLKILALLERPDRGFVEAFGLKITAEGWDGARAKLAGRIAYVPQEPELYAVPLGSLLGLCGRREEALSWAKEFGLAPYLGRNAASLSPGLRRRAQLAIALACARDALLLDEPAAHLDEEGRELLATALSARKDLAIAYVEHGEEAARCDRAYALERGVLRLIY
jgi:ABC-type multidrug transport system ATPase subunit